MERMSAWMPAPPPESEPAIDQGDDGLHPPTLVSTISVGTLGAWRPLSSRIVHVASRLVVGTGGFRSLDVLEASLLASESSIATVALRRVDPRVEGSIYDLLTRLSITLLPNTAGCFSAEEAVQGRRARPRGFRHARWSSSRSSATTSRCCPTRPRRWSRPTSWCDGALRSGPTPRTT